EPDLYLELHEEIERLPEQYRSPIVLCYLQGQTQEQASKQLDWPLGTVQTRLHRGRQRLRTRLARRGVGPPGLAALALTVPEGRVAGGSVAVAPTWASATARAAVRFAAGKSTAEVVAPAVVRLAEGALALMLRDTLTGLGLLLLAIGLAGAGVG